MDGPDLEGEEMDEMEVRKRMKKKEKDLNEDEDDGGDRSSNHVEG